MRFATILLAALASSPAVAANAWDYETIYCGDVEFPAASGPARICFNAPADGLAAYGVVIFVGHDGQAERFPIIDGTQRGTFAKPSASISYDFTSPFESAAAMVDVEYTYVPGTYPGDGGFEPTSLRINLGEDFYYVVPELAWTADVP